MTDNRHELEDFDQYIENIGSTPEEEEEAKKFWQHRILSVHVKVVASTKGV